jgi:hypothetical protein
MRSYNFVPRRNFEFDATTMFSEMVPKATFSEITATAMFVKRLPRQRNIGCHDKASTED